MTARSGLASMKKMLCLKTAVAKGIGRWAVTLAAAACVSAVHAAAPVDVPATGQPTKKPLTVADVLAASTPADWRQIDPQSTIYMDLPAGRVIIELAPQFAPHYVANVETLARQGYFNGLWVERVQDNYVAQWGDPDAKKPVGNAQRTVAAEFERTSRGLSFMPLAEPDTYAPEVGFSDGPRHLDRNVTLLGKVVQGIELLSSLPRGTGAMGFYEKPEQRVTIKSFKLASEVPEAQRTPLEELRTDTQTFTDYIDARRNRHEEWFKVPAGHVDVCNVPIPVRARAAAR
jgi:peptidylprolyl isomerase